MNYLNESHQQLSESQQSGLLERFASLRFDHRVSLIGLSAALGVLCSGLAWSGQSSDRIYFCVQRPDASLQCQDKNNRPFRMTAYHWAKWQSGGMPTQIVVNPSVGNVQGEVAANNPYKPMLALGAFLGFAAAGWMLRHLQHEESKLAPLEAIAQQRTEAVADMAARAAVVEAYREVAIKQAEVEADVQLIQHENFVRLGQAEVFGQAEIHIAELEAEEAKFEAQTAGLSDEQKQEYIDFLRQQRTPFLPGMTLDGINNPSDKMTGDGAVRQFVPPENDELFFDITRINPSDPTHGKNIIVIAEQGVGKTTLAKYLAGEVLKSDDIQVYDLDDDGKTWGNLPTWGTGDDETQIAGAMQADMELFDERTEDRVKGRKFGLSARIVDENPAVYDVIPEQHEDWAFKMGSRARKRGFVVILLTQERDPAANGLTSNRLRNYNQIFLGRKQVNHALNYLAKPKAVADRLRPLVEQCDRPALIEFNGDWFYWNVPNLKAWEQEFNRGTDSKINPASDIQLGISSELPPTTPETMGNDIRQRLEFLINQPKPVELPPEAEAIVTFSLKKGAVSVRDCIAGIRVLRGKSSEDVRALFELLIARGKGVLTGDGEGMFLAADT